MAKREAKIPADAEVESDAADESVEADTDDGELQEEEVVVEAGEVEAEVSESETETDDDTGEPIVPEVDPDGGARSLVTSDPLQRYLTEIRRYPILSREEEHELAVRYKEKGDIEAAYKLVTGNLRLVVMIAREYQRATRQLLDLIQEGNIGLMEGVKNFDPYRGIRFPSYAVWWVRAYVIRYLMNNWRVVKVGTTQAQRKLFFNLQKEKERLEREGIYPSPKLIAQRLDVKEHEVVEMDQRMGSSDLSVDAPMGNADGASMLDFLPSRQFDTEAQFADAEFKQRVGDKIREFGATLKDKEKVIFDSRLMSETPMTLQEIGTIYKVSRERVRQIEERLKKKLKSFLVKELKDLEETVKH